MPIDYVQEVVRLAALAAPREQPKNSDWQKLEAEFGYEFAPDFKELVSQLGSGSFGCGLTLQNPYASIGHTRISRESLILHREPIQDLEESLSIALYPSPGGMVLIASMDRQDFYLGPGSPSAKSLDQLVWMDIDVPRVTPLNSTFSQFIHDLYLGLLTEPWAQELREYYWRGGKEPFFSSAPEIKTRR